MERPTRATRAILTSSITEFADAVHTAIATAAERNENAAILSVVLDAAGGAHGAPPVGQGDGVQQQVIELIRRNLRGHDVVAHPPGEEILVLLPGATRDQANHVATRLCAAIRSHAFTNVPGDRARADVTASVGVASAPTHGRHVDTVSHAARQARAAVAADGGDGAATAAARETDPPTRTLELGRFAGRVEEMAQLRRWLDEAIAGSPRAVAVVGEPGSGRGALLRQLEPEVRLRGGSLVIARARSGSVRSPYGIWTQVLLALRRLPDAPSKPWHELMHLHPEIVGSDEERAGSKYRLLEEISEYVRLAARSRPLVLVLDEMQWVDAASWDALDHLLTQLERERVLIGLTIRDDPALTDIAERRRALERIDYYHEVRLSRLTRDEVKRWLEGAMQRQEIGRELLAYVYRHTEGNPLFIVQLIRCMLDEGFLRHNGTRWEWSPVSELRLPNGLDAIIARRVERLPREVHEVLDVAALIGRQFEMDLVMKAGDWAPDAVRSAIHEAINAELLQPNYERGGRGHVFAHARVADAFVATIPSDRLPRLHERVARAMADQPRRAAETAAHFDAAHCPADAYRHALDAATHAESLYAYDSAREFLELGSRNATSPAELAEVRVRLALLAETVGRYDEAEELCDLAIEWFDGQGDRTRALTLRRMRERARKELGQPPMVTLDALRALDEEASGLGSDRERVEILTMLSQTYGRIGDPKEAERLAQECVQLAERVNDNALIAAALNRLAITVEHQSPQRAREYFERALTLFQRLGDVRGQARAHNNLGILAQLEMRADYGRESLTMAMTLARAAGMPDLAGIAALNLGVVTQKIGDYESAKELFGEALALFAAVRNGELQLYVLYNMANLERERGEFAQGAELYESTSSLAQRIGQSDVEIGALAGEGLCLLSMQRNEAAKVQAALVEQRMASRTGWFQGRELVDALRVRLATTEERPEDAIAAFETARQLAEDFDVYSAAWLTAACADVLFTHYPEQIQQAIQRYAGQVQSLGFADLVRRYEVLQSLNPRPA